MLCIPKSVVDAVKTAIKSGDIPIEKLYDMTSEERGTLFEHYVGKDSAKLVNGEFEKAMVAADKQAKSDYVTASEKQGFARTAAAGKFGEKLLTPEQKGKFAVAKIDANIDAARTRQERVQEQLKTAQGETKANLEFKLRKYQDQEARLNVKREDALNPARDRMLAKVESIKTLLSPEEDKAFMSDLVSTKMGQDVTPAQGKYIVDQASRLQELKQANSGSIIGVTPEYLRVRANLENYIANLNPEHAGINILRNLVEISRNNVITSIATPLKTAIGGTENVVSGRIIRRLANLSLRGGNPDIARAIDKATWDAYRKTGANAASMESMDDAGGVLGSHQIRGGAVEKLTKGETYGPPKPGAGGGVLGAADAGVARVAQFSNKVAITIEHNILFTKFYSSAFADALNFKSMDMARVEGLRGDAAKTRAAEMMHDAAKVEPQTEAGAMLRKNAQAVAQKTLNANDTWASRFSVGMKNALNTVGEKAGIPFGTLLEPIAKIPANLYANALKTTPAGIPNALIDMVKGKMDMSVKNDLETRYQGAMRFKDGYEQMLGIAGSVSMAYLLTSGLTQKDFRADSYGDQYVKFGDTWINLEYMSRLSPNIAGIMAAKAASASAKSSLAGDISAFLIGKKAGQGALGGLLHIPGLDTANQTVQAALTKTAGSKFLTAVKGRAVPAGLLNLTKDRPLNRSLFGATGVETQAQVDADNKAKAQKAAQTRAANARAAASGG